MNALKNALVMMVAVVAIASALIVFIAGCGRDEPPKPVDCQKAANRNTERCPEPLTDNGDGTVG